MAELSPPKGVSSRYVASHKVPEFTGTDEEPILTVAELPRTLRFALKISHQFFSSKVLDKLVEILIVCLGNWWIFIAMWHLTTIEVAVLFHVLFTLSHIVSKFSMADYSSKDSFAVKQLLSLSRSDRIRGSRMLRSDMCNMYSVNICLVVVLFPLGVLPFASSSTSPVLTIVSCVISILFYIASSVRFSCQFLSNMLLRSWSRRVKNYVVKMREILLDGVGVIGDLESAGETDFVVAKALSLEQDKNEEWARQTIRLMAPKTSAMIAFTLLCEVASLVTLASRPGTQEKRINSIAALSFMAAVNSYYLFHNCRLAAL